MGNLFVLPAMLLGVCSFQPTFANSMEFSKNEYNIADAVKCNCNCVDADHNNLGQKYEKPETVNGALSCAMHEKEDCPKAGAPNKWTCVLEYP